MILNGTNFKAVPFFPLYVLHTCDNGYVQLVHTVYLAYIKQFNYQNIYTIVFLLQINWEYFLIVDSKKKNGEKEKQKRNIPLL